MYFQTHLHRCCSTEIELEKGHGRIETRRYWLTDHIDWLEQKSEWAHLKAIGMVESSRHIAGQTSIEKRYYLLSLANIKDFARAVCQHWFVENKLHWVLDVAFQEDYSRVRVGYAAENFSTLPRIALNLLKQEKTSKRAKEGKIY